MAGSFQHVLDENGNYRGCDLLENMGDMKEAVDEMAFIILWLRSRPVWQAARMVQDALDIYNACSRGEMPWPGWFMPEDEEEINHER